MFKLINRGVIWTRNATSGRVSEEGVTTVEYAVMLVLVAIGVLAFGTGLKNSVTGVFSNLVSALKP